MPISNFWIHLVTFLQRVYLTGFCVVNIISDNCYWVTEKSVFVSEFVFLSCILSGMCFYFQTRDAILKGAHPVSEREALYFSALQMQIQFGEHDETKHKPGFLE